MTLNQFIDTLKNSEDPGIKEFTVIPTPFNISIVNEV